MFRILTILILLAVLATLVNGCSSKQILPTPFGEMNVIRNLIDLITDDEEEIETETEEKDIKRDVAITVNSLDIFGEVMK